MLICHITTRAAWAAAQPKGEFLPPEFSAHGFVHCSTPEQVVLVVNAFFAGRNDLTMLMIDTARLKSEVIWEDAHAEGRIPEFAQYSVFPHVYGPINLDAVVRTVDLEPTSTGTFVLQRPV
jgi:uncharacterized protein (DUF952 family)